MSAYMDTFKPGPDYLRGYIRHEYADGTYLLEHRGMYGGWGGGKALCDDGKVRSLKRMARYADTWFSVPAAVNVWVPEYTSADQRIHVPAYGTTVAGYITITTRDGFSTATLDDPAIVRFHAYTYRKNHALVEGEKAGTDTHKGSEKASTL